jgi:hypothetical protein
VRAGSRAECTRGNRSNSHVHTHHGPFTNRPQEAQTRHVRAHTCTASHTHPHGRARAHSPGSTAQGVDRPFAFTMSKARPDCARTIVWMNSNTRTLMRDVAASAVSVGTNQRISRRRKPSSSDDSNACRKQAQHGNARHEHIATAKQQQATTRSNNKQQPFINPSMHTQAATTPPPLENTTSVCGRQGGGAW